MVRNNERQNNQHRKHRRSNEVYCKNRIVEKGNRRRVGKMTLYEELDSGLLGFVLLMILFSYL